MALYEFSVTVTTQYVEAQSDPAKDNYVFSYTITVKNTGTVGAQLIARHWIITDGNGKVEEVRGLGAVGYQPLLAPGQQFEYTSGTSMVTPHGSMHGSYFCITEQGEIFTTPIPEFLLVQPRTLH